MASSLPFTEKSIAQESSINDSYLAPEARFECPICLAWLRDPLLTSCGHRFCRRCIESWLQRENPCCPVDNMTLTKDDIFPDNFTRREINQQRTKCPNIIRGCLEQLNPLDVESHLLICQFKLPELPENEKLRCSFVHLGCEEKFEDEIELENHLQQQIHKHLNMILSACNKFSVSQSANSVIAEEAKFWDAPSKNGQASSSDNGNLNELLRALYEKHVISEQKSREQDIIIANLSEQIQSQTLTLSKMSLRNCNGCYLWYFSDFKQKLGAMRNDNRIMHYSPGFYTSLNGYRLCIRLNISPNSSNSIAILIHMMKTEHDNTLDWPFSGRLTITFIHPIDASRNIKETMMTRPNLEAFQRPIQDMNPKGFGYTEFTTIDELLSQGFIEKNQLIIKVQAQPV
ncbi:TNF receptor-associated factor 6 [Harmonia axyridis]|uniref:TNF receptor-associated factor 6 n=1 Tax=Harmonia axyridis TaxID=115357 RepID=UPI001E275199|nr:TNF receptor-associated factor 6 [Harmonia axyridis]